MTTGESIPRASAVEAIVACLVFGEDIGLACERARRDGGEDGAVYPGAGNIVDLSAGARDLVAEAMAIASGIQPEICGPGVSSWDVRGAVARRLADESAAETPGE